MNETKPTYDQIAEMAKGTNAKRAPVSMEILADVATPIEALLKLQNVSDHVFMLESMEDPENWGRYTFLGYDPLMEIVADDGVLFVDGKEVGACDPNGFIRTVLCENKTLEVSDLPSFTGGLVGFFAYDYIKYAEPSLRLDAEAADGFQDIDLMLFDKIIAFDNLRQKIIIIKSMRIADGEKGYKEACAELEKIAKILSTGEKKKYEPGRLMSEFEPYFKKDEFCDMVERAKHHITEGDIFQIVLSNRLSADYEGSLVDTYRILRTLNPSPYMFYFSGTGHEVAGASPETLVKLENGELHTFPLAGTRPRGKTPSEDKALEADLMIDEKELAEHNMLVDLGRNDIGRISKFGTVEVEKYHEILRFSHVMHIGSTVRGEIKDSCDQLDAISSVLPAGTLSGAPKIRACQIINDLEGCKRGIYGGGIGYIDLAGNLDTCIAIRIAYKKNGKVFVRSGAGIVADSVPEKEFAECINKAQAVIQAIKEAELMS